jgi:Flp pilus assembly protein TadB
MLTKFSVRRFFISLALAMVIGFVLGLLGTALWISWVVTGIYTAVAVWWTMKPKGNERRHTNEGH